jgi:hypothetical protein
MHAGETDFRVLVATGVNVQEVMDQIDERPCYVFEIEFERGPLAEITTGDVYLIRRYDDVPQSIAVCKIVYYFGCFIENNDEPFFTTSSRQYGVFGNRMRCPSMAVYPWFLGQQASLSPTVLVEVEFEPRSLQAMHAYCLDYFRDPCVLAVLLFKYFPQHAANRTLFEAVAVLYRRGPPSGEPAVADAVSFGTAPLSPDARDGTPPDVGRALRVLPAPPLNRAAGRWAPALRPFLTVPAEDFNFLAGRGGGPSPRDLTLDLWDLFKAGLLPVPARLSRTRPPPGLEPGTPPAPAAAPPRLRS